MPLTSCQSSMTLAAGAESSKVHYKPLHHAGNRNEYRANTDQYVCNFACFVFLALRAWRARPNTHFRKLPYVSSK
jgi:hypothetical protein